MRRTPMQRTPFKRKNNAENKPSKVAQSHSQSGSIAVKSVAKMRTKSKPATPAKEKRYLDRVAQLDCVVCGAHGVHVHHLREGQGMGQRASNFLTAPLCPSCHTGPRGIHGDRSVLRQEKLDEMDLLARTIERLNS